MPKDKTLVKFDNETNRYYIKHDGKRVYLFDKRFKNETPTKAYLKLLEEVLKKNKSAIYHLNRKALNTTQIISLLSKYNIDIPKYHRSVDKIRRTLKQYKNKIDFEVINYQEAYKNKGVFHIDIKPKAIGLNEVTDTSVKMYFARAINYIMKHVRKLFNSGNNNSQARDDWKFMIWIHNSENGFQAASGPPAKLDSKFLDKFLERVKQFIVSGDVQDLRDMYISVKGHYEPKGGAINNGQRVDLFKKRSLIKIKNEGNSCFWHATAVTIFKSHKKINQIKDGRGQVRTKLAQHLCEAVGMAWDSQVSIEDIAKVEQAINKRDAVQYQFCVLNIDELPKFQHTGSILDSLMYKGVEAPNKIWLLYDNGHYHVITDIKKFLGVEAFCPKCFKALYKTSQVKNHECDVNVHNDSNSKKQVKRKQKRKTCSFPKDRGHYLIQHEAKTCKANQRYVIYDIEADPTNKHVPNKVIAKEYFIPAFSHDFNEYLELTTENSIIGSHTFDGDDCIDKFCDWLLLQPFESKKKQKKSKSTRESPSDLPHNANYQSTTVIAHNQKGYDARFILAWCQKRSFLPSNLIRSGSKIQYMFFKAGSIKFIDSLNFFLEPLRNLSKSYGIKTLKGYFPHKMNTPEYQDYEGPMPPEEFYEPGSMNPKDYDKFKKWYENDVQNNVQFNFKKELHKYCDADVELLAKAVFKFRHIFLEMVKVDPFQYITLASLCKAIYIANDLPEHSIVGNEHNKTSSRVGREWLYYIQQTQSISMHEEQPIFLEYVKSSRLLTCKVLKKTFTATIPFDMDFKHFFVSPPPLKAKLPDGTTITVHPTKDKYTAHLTVDGYCKDNNTVYEFYGCHYHGCSVCCLGDEEAKIKHEKSMERLLLLEMVGINVQHIWGCEWNRIKKTLPNKKHFELMAERRTITTRDAFYGGRTEVIKKYHKCIGRQRIGYRDVTSEYPTVNALDPYAVGFRRYRASTTIDDILNDEFIGLVKCVIEPPTDLHIPVLPRRTCMKLLFTLEPGEGTWTTLELKKALEKGYKITEIYSATEYKKMNGLMKSYVERFLHMKIENSGKLTAEECAEINEYHASIGLSIIINPENTCDNPGKRKVAKICLNSLWGKFGQRAALESYDFARTFTEFTRLVSNPGTIVSNYEIISDNLVEVRYTEDTDYVNESEHISEIVAAFTSSNARLRLYAFVDWLHHSQILYMDTDSCFYLYDPDNPEHINPDDENQVFPDKVSLGGGLGQWSNELGPDEYITEFVATGPKSYAYITNKINENNKDGKFKQCDCKAKGLTLDVSSSQLITLQSMKNLIDQVVGADGKPITYVETAERSQFIMDKKTKEMNTVPVTKKLHDTVNEKRESRGYETVPFGFKDLQ